MKTLTLLDALELFCKQVLPTAKIALLNLPKTPQSDLLVMINPVPEERAINGLQTRIVTTWDVIYFHSHAAQVVESVDKLRRAFVHGITIPFLDEDENTMRYIRVQAFSPSPMNENESDLKYILCKLETVTSDVLSVEQFETMQEIAFNKEVRP
ncbi:hypothetical protein [Pseudobacillus badius]|uniref:hypothetical protein n=1 Tax=Bacillus badius TaxID=1455 RepID=UPI0024A3F571|nr:hypothetical protein [Bacillus badius]GLY11415.1 hypothetical protein Bbad01_26310 [Bacillus badius]